MSGWYGKNCSQEINECLESNECLNGGTCIDLVDDFSCQCPPFYTGKFDLVIMNKIAHLLHDVAKFSTV